jgi:hypothetical protein
MKLPSLLTSGAPLIALSLGLSGCNAFRADLSNDGELNQEYRLKHLYAECLKKSATDGVDCSELKQKMRVQQEWDIMEGDG